VPASLACILSINASLSPLISAYATDGPKPLRQILLMRGPAFAAVEFKKNFTMLSSIINLPKSQWRKNYEVGYFSRT
jgi:hypothetical protein